MNFARLAVLSITVAVGAWLVGYTYLVKITGYPSSEFFSWKMVIGLLTVSFATCVTFRLRGFFKTSR
jgi:hypothetical protein